MEIIRIFLCLLLCIISISASCDTENLDGQKILQTLAAQQDAIEQLTKENRDLRNQFNQLKRDTRRCSNNKRLLTEEPYGENFKVGFTAKLSQHIMNLGNNQAIIFDAILTNIGQHYSSHTGVFTAPTNATYYFSASIMSHTGEQLQTEIVKNGDSMVKMYSYDSKHEQGSNSVVLQLNTGDEVWVRHRGTYGTKTFGSGWSTFSGFRISDD